MSLWFVSRATCIHNEWAYTKLVYPEVISIKALIVNYVHITAIASSYM